MRSTLTEQEIADYRENGFLAIQDLLSQSELTHWRDAVDSAIAEDLVRAPEDSAAAKAKVFDQRMNLRRVDASIRGLVEGPSVGKLVALLEGVDAVRIYLDQALVKEPYGPPTQFHQDLPWWPFESDHACTIWIGLDDATIENGCLYFVPGSHRLELTYRSDLGPQLGAIFADNVEVKRAPVPTPLPAGGCTFHNAQTIHGAGANMTQGRRRAMTVAFMPDGVRFNGTRDAVRVLGEEYIDTLATGDLLQNDELNPLVYSREGSAASRSG
ncbi:MAG: phytanoyl-CoA dioxygenase family protein [Chloroflexi bacterium]|nr:phytanoyl-CoA dioxygenase family protein [Chloroflexota bacterium]